MFKNSKYGNVLTVILIISIIAIVGILSFLGYRIYSAYYIDAGATQAATQFEQGITSNNSSSENKNVGNTIDISGIEDFFTTNNTVQSEGGSVTKYKGFTVVGTINIPKIDLKYPILERLTATSLKTSVVLMYTSQGLNEEGNSVIIGHNYRNGTMFSDVDKLVKGDLIYITDTVGRKVKYKIYDIFRAPGDESEYITRNTNGKREISLSTCTDDSKARTIVLAVETE